MKVTIFTPTYNRAYILNKLKESLLRQTNKDFEWLIIDDGSTDSTDILVKGWIEETKEFPIRYYHVNNGGKCRAINKALDLAKGELFFTMDSDDYLSDDAVDKIIKWERDLPKSEKFCGIIGNTGYTANDTINIRFKEKYIDTDMLKAYRYQEDGNRVLDGERAHIFYTEIHKRYRYPEYEGENFMTEAVTWNRMAHNGYKVRFYNDIIWIFEYQNDGLTRAGHQLFLDNPYGYGLWLREKVLFTNNTLLSRLKLYYSFYCELKDKYTITKIADCMGISAYKMYIVGGLNKVWNLLRGDKYNDKSIFTWRK